MFYKILIILFLSNLCFGSTESYNNRTKANIMSLGMALRSRFYPFVDAKELKMLLRHTGQPDDQNFIFARFRISDESYKIMEEIEAIASVVEHGTSLENLDEEQMKKVRWLSDQYAAITLHDCSSKLGQ